MSFADTTPIAPLPPLPGGGISESVPKGLHDKDTLYWDDNTKRWVSSAPSVTMPDGVDDMDILTWDANLKKWVTTADYFGDETNIVGMDKAMDGDILVYDELNNTWKVQEQRFQVTNPPANLNSPGELGQVASDANAIYICVAKDTWVSALRDGDVDIGTF